jgi:hypothetical protein
MNFNCANKISQLHSEISINILPFGKIKTHLPDTLLLLSAHRNYGFYGCCATMWSLSEYILLDDYYKHQCADNNNNVSGKCVFILPKGKIFIGISECS